MVLPPVFALVLSALPAAGIEPGPLLREPESSLGPTPLPAKPGTLEQQVQGAALFPDVEQAAAPDISLTAPTLEARLGRQGAADLRRQH